MGKTVEELAKIGRDAMVKSAGSSDTTTWEQQPPWFKKHWQAAALAIRQAVLDGVANDCVCMGGTEETCNQRHQTGPCDCAGGKCTPREREAWEQYWPEYHRANKAEAALLLSQEREARLREALEEIVEATDEDRCDTASKCIAASEAAYSIANEALEVK